jgi:hypothetical protein
MEQKKIESLQYLLRNLRRKDSLIFPAATTSEHFDVIIECLEFIFRLYQPERLNPETIDSAWIKWEVLKPPRDIQGIFIRFDDERIWTGAHFFGSDEYRAKTCGDAKPVSWTFKERKDSSDKSVQC